MKKILALSALMFALLVTGPVAAMAQWQKVFDTLGRGPISTVAIHGNNLFAGTWGGGVFVSTDQGNTWKGVNDGINDLRILSFGFCDTTVLIGTMGGIYYSADTGQSWTPSFALRNNPISSFATHDTNIFAGTAMTPGGGLYRSHDDGILWEKAGPAYMDTLVTAVAANGPKIFIGSVLGSGVFFSNDGGSNWNVVTYGLTRRNIEALGCYGNLTFAGTDSAGIFVSTDDGAHWTSVNTGIEGVLWIYSFAFSGRSVFAGTSVGIYYSADTGAHWSSVSNPGSFDPSPAVRIESDGSYLYAASYTDGLWRRSISEMTGVSGQAQAGFLPTAFSLGQNYPNPFNPSTDIEYQIPKQAYVTLKVYNLLGQEVATIVDEHKQPGVYHVRWDASRLPSGIYFYKLNAGDFRQTKRMVLVK